MIAVNRETWILMGFVALAVAALAITVAGAILLLRQRRARRP
ncbi:MAG TPA: hypothetical protein VGB19_06870 [Actinomycetota bacterium]